MTNLTGSAVTGLPWTNADGLHVPFGNYYANRANFVNRPWQLLTYGSIKQLEVDVDLTTIPTGTTWATADANNDGTSDSFQEGDPYLPANCSVIRATFVATIGATGGTSFTVGTYSRAGVIISATSLITATEGVIANIAAAGQRVYGAGALTSATAGTSGVGTTNAFIGVSTTGTFTAGTGRLIIEYINPNLIDSVANN